MDAWQYDLPVYRDVLPPRCWERIKQAVAVYSLLFVAFVGILALFAVLALMDRRHKKVATPRARPTSMPGASGAPRRGTRGVHF
jgi:hypothetical protein